MNDVPKPIIEAINITHAAFAKYETKYNFSSLRMANRLLHMIIGERLKEAFGYERDEFATVDALSYDEYEKAAENVVYGINTMSRLSGRPKIRIIQQYLNLELPFLDLTPDRIKETAVAK